MRVLQQADVDMKAGAFDHDGLGIGVACGEEAAELATQAAVGGQLGAEV